LFNPLSSGTARTVAVAACSVLLLAASSSIAIGRMAVAGQAIDPQVAAQVTMLTGEINAEVKRQPATASVETFEAAILFVVDQSAQPVNVVCSALDNAKMEPGTPNNARIAMDNVCRTIRRRSGTGALGGTGAGAGFGAASFGIPSIAVGGGGSNYTPTQR
jgi:hypothetical protein